MSSRPLNDIKSYINTFFVYEEKGKILGCCSLEIYGQKLAEVRSLVVLAKYQNKGIGTKLLQECINEARNLGIYEVLAVTEKTSLFRKLGFRESIDDKHPMIVKPNGKFGDILET